MKKDLTTADEVPLWQIVRFVEETCPLMIKMRNFLDVDEDCERRVDDFISENTQGDSFRRKVDTPRKRVT